MDYHGPTMSTRVKASPAREAWQLATDMWFSESPPRVPAVAAAFDLSPMGLKLLYCLEPAAETAMSAVAGQCGCDASNVTGIVDRLEARGLIERRDDPRDRRVKLIALTGEGAEVRSQMLDRLYEPPQAIAALPAADQRALRDIMRRAAQAR
jgi:MarR family transcriptional regulator, organic hydroperoxide resistance regulator